uniref:Uncharacterized protein n=1 Tax=Arundo donax TaxID=35708 RepID=A0A0A9CH41_ARUDO
MRTSRALQNRPELILDLLQMLLWQHLHFLSNQVNPLPSNLPQQHPTNTAGSTDNLQLGDTICHFLLLVWLICNNSGTTIALVRLRRPSIPGTCALGGGVVPRVRVGARLLHIRRAILLQ